LLIEYEKYKMWNCKKCVMCLLTVPPSQSWVMFLSEYAALNIHEVDPYVAENSYCDFHLDHTSTLRTISWHSVLSSRMYLLCSYVKYNAYQHSSIITVIWTLLNVTLTHSVLFTDVTFDLKCRWYSDVRYCIVHTWVYN
jgi:hypothetical protein